MAQDDLQGSSGGRWPTGRVHKSLSPDNAQPDRDTEQLVSWQRVLEDAETQIHNQAAENEYLRSRVRVMEWHLQNGATVGGADGTLSEVAEPTGPNKGVEDARQWQQGNNIVRPSQTSELARLRLQRSEHDSSASHDASLPSTPTSLAAPNRNKDIHGGAPLLGLPGPQDVVLGSARVDWLEEQLHTRDRMLGAAQVDAAAAASQVRTLERRLAELRVAYEAQQAGLVDAAQRALAYRKDVLHENLRLTRSLEQLEQERSIFMSTLLPLIAEFGLHPSPTDARHVVHSVKMVVQRLLSEMSHGEGRRPIITNSGALEGPEISHEAQEQEPALQLVRSNQAAQQTAPHASSWTSQKPRGSQDEVDRSQQVREPRGPSWTDAVNSAVEDRRSAPRRQSADDLLPSAPAPAPEASESVEPLPAIEGLRIVGDAVLGGKLTACGHSIHGTSLCVFQWVRQYSDGSADYIEGAASPEYIITADDCNTIVAIECVPMDEQGRRGELVRVAANEGLVICPDALLQDQLNAWQSDGMASFDVTLVDARGSPYNGMAAACVLQLRRAEYVLKRARKSIFKEPLAALSLVEIPVNHSTAIILHTGDDQHLCLDLRDSRTRDLAVLALRHFKSANERAPLGRKGRSWLGLK